MTEVEAIRAEAERIERANAEMKLILASNGLRMRSKEEIERECQREAEQRKKHQAYLADLYLTGKYEIFKRACPVCGTVFYTANSRQVYDDYYLCSRYEHRANAKKRRETRRATICSTCGKPFTPARAGGKYCSNACKQRAYRNRVTNNACGHFGHTRQE